MELFSPRRINMHKFQNLCPIPFAMYTSVFVYVFCIYYYNIYLFCNLYTNTVLFTYISSRLGAGMGGLCYSLGRDSDLRHPYNDLWSVAGGLRQRQEIDPVSSDIHPLSHSR